MSDLVHDAQHEFWRPPATLPAAEPGLADACRRCGTEFMVGAAFCHICGSGRHHAGAHPSRTWTKYFEWLRALNFARIKGWFGLPVPSLCAFLAGVGFLMVALTMGLTSVHEYADFELWRIQWLMASIAAFVAGILLKSRRSED